MKILGREPAVFYTLLASIFLALIKFLPVPAELAGALNAAVLAGAGFATALTVSAEKALPALVGLVQAVFAVLLAYGSPVPESTQTGILALIAAAGAWLVRQNVLAPVTANLATYEEVGEAVYQNGYQAGQDDAVPTFTAEDMPEPLRFEETGTRGHTEVFPAVGQLSEEAHRDER